MKPKEIIKRYIKTFLNIIIGKPSPANLLIEITNNCNSRCIYCNYWNRKTKEMSLDLYKKIINEAYEIGIIEVRLSGGEPLLHKNIIEMLKYAHDKGLFTTLLSNGLILHKRINEIKEYTDLFTISLDTLNPEKYDAIRGVKQGLNQCLKSIQAVINIKKPLELTTVVSKNNIDEIESLIKFAKDNKVTIGLMPIHDYKNGQVTIGTIDPLIKNAYKKILNLKKQESETILFSTKYLESLAYDKNIKCNRNNLTINVNTQGDIEIECPFLKTENELSQTKQEYNLTNHSLKELYYGENSRKQRIKERTCTKCKQVCMMEPSLIANKDLSVIIEYTKTGLKMIKKLNRKQNLKI